MSSTPVRWRVRERLCWAKACSAINCTLRRRRSDDVTARMTEGTLPIYELIA